MPAHEAETLGAWRPWVLREAALQAAQARLSREPLALETRFERALLLGELGRIEEAKQAYLELLVLSPSHFGALNNLGAILYSRGFRTAARTCYAEAAARHPENPVGHVNLANALVEDGNLVPAREHFEKALSLAPDHADAHRGLGNLFWALGDEEASKRHQRLGFQNQNVIAMPYRGRSQPIPVLLVISAMTGNIPIGPYLDDQIYHVTVIVAEFCDTALPLPPHRLMINAIGDADLCKPALQAAMKLAARTQSPVLNHPAAVLKTGRIANASRLRQVPGVITPAMTSLPRAVLAQPGAIEMLAALGFVCPFLLRTPGFHNGHNFLKIENADGLKAALDKLPGREFTVMQFLDGRSADGKIRKYRAMMIGGEIFPLHAAISHDWKVHYVTAEMAGRPEHLAEDAAYLNAMPEVLGPCAMAALEGIRDALGLDYAGVDFSVDERGQLLLFEANATMVVIAPDPGEQWAYRRAPVERVMNAIRKMLADKAAHSSETGSPRKVA